MSPRALRLTEVSVRYGDRPALRDVDLEIAPGEVVALAGPNGSGKTTLLRTVLGFVPAAHGSVEILGAPLPSLTVRERARRVAWVPQGESARDNVRLRDYVLYGRYAHRSGWEGPSHADFEIADRALEDAGLADRANDGLLTISGGERQRAILARALAQETPILLLDEPTTHLDLGHQLDLLERVRTLSRSRRVTVVAALHDLNLAARFSDRIVVLSRGRIVADGPPPAVLSEELLARVWGVASELRREPRTGAPYLLPLRVLPAPGDAQPRPTLGPVHVVGGGGSAGVTLRRLADEGFELSAGAHHLLDSDTSAADALGVPTAVEVPFAPLGADVRSRNRALLDRARAIVVAPFPVGPSNLANLDDLLPYAGRVPILYLPRPEPSAWDFSGGAATQRFEELRQAGAREVADDTALVAELRRLLPPTAGSARAPPGPSSSG
jgi:iron complex transport system ATP-binding protein